MAPAYSGLDMQQENFNFLHKTEMPGTLNFLFVSV